MKKRKTLKQLGAAFISLGLLLPPMNLSLVQAKEEIVLLDADASALSPENEDIPGYNWSVSSDYTPQAPSADIIPGELPGSEDRQPHTIDTNTVWIIEDGGLSLTPNITFTVNAKLTIYLGGNITANNISSNKAPLFTVNEGGTLNIIGTNNEYRIKNSYTASDTTNPGIFTQQLNESITNCIYTNRMAPAISIQGGEVNIDFAAVTGITTAGYYSAGMLQNAYQRGVVYMKGGALNLSNSAQILAQDSYAVLVGSEPNYHLYPDYTQSNNTPDYGTGVLETDFLDDESKNTITFSSANPCQLKAPPTSNSGSTGLAAVTHMSGYLNVEGPGYITSNAGPQNSTFHYLSNKDINIDGIAYILNEGLGACILDDRTLFKYTDNNASVSEDGVDNTEGTITIGGIDKKAENYFGIIRNAAQGRGIDSTGSDIYIFGNPTPDKVLPSNNQYGSMIINGAQNYAAVYNENGYLWIQDVYKIQNYNPDNNFAATKGPSVVISGTSEFTGSGQQDAVLQNIQYIIGSTTEKHAIIHNDQKYSNISPDDTYNVAPDLTIQGFGEIVDLNKNEDKEYRSSIYSFGDLTVVGTPDPENSGLKISGPSTIESNNNSYPLIRCQGINLKISNVNSIINTSGSAIIYRPSTTIFHLGDDEYLPMPGTAVLSNIGLISGAYEVNSTGVSEDENSVYPVIGIFGPAANLNITGCTVKNTQPYTAIAVNGILNIGSTTVTVPDDIEASTRDATDSNPYAAVISVNGSRVFEHTEITSGSVGFMSLGDVNNIGLDSSNFDWNTGNFLDGTSASSLYGKESGIVISGYDAGYIASTATNTPEGQGPIQPNTTNIYAGVFISENTEQNPALKLQYGDNADNGRASGDAVFQPAAALVDYDESMDNPQINIYAGTYISAVGENPVNVFDTKGTSMDPEGEGKRIHVRIGSGLPYSGAFFSYPIPGFDSGYQIEDPNFSYLEDELCEQQYQQYNGQWPTYMGKTIPSLNTTVANQYAVKAPYDYWIPYSPGEEPPIIDEDPTEEPEDPVIPPYVPPYNPGTPSEPDEPMTPPTLNTKDHFAYIVGRTPTTVAPNAEMRREEVVTVWFRLLTDEVREQYWSKTNDYADVPSTLWCNNAISTLTKLGIVEGYPDWILDGKVVFGPGRNITRAEFITMAVRFFDDAWLQQNTDGSLPFNDIDGHWAEKYIIAGQKLGLIEGYLDGSFRPDQNITRAEAITIFNRVLGRKPHVGGLYEDMVEWTDNQDVSEWYYATIQEATNSHTFSFDYVVDNETYEKWHKPLPIRDWAAFQEQWSTPESAPNPGSVWDDPVNDQD